MTITEDRLKCEKAVEEAIEGLRHNFALPAIKRAYKKLYGDSK